ncbi:MAG TPA: hypothetical protein VGT60_11970 [Candidatus Limnocylindria bacterium]|nr:hypothetical protein [Candidatus Limnocylindria bacterium]
MTTRSSVWRIARWLVVPVAAVVLGATVDPAALPFSGAEKIYAVFLLDGQAYFGHLEDVPWSDSVTLTDSYYFEDARKTTTELPVGLLKRGGELHQPADGMRIRRDKILAIERVGPDSPVARAIETQRAIDRGAAR